MRGDEPAAGGQNVYYIGYNQDMAIEYVEACGMWARVFNHAASTVEEGIWEDDGDDKNIKTFTIKFPDSGHRIVALSSRPANLRGKQGVVVIDEAAFHDKLDELLKAALALLIWGGKVRVISTHNGERNPFNELINDIRAGKRRGSVQRITFKEAVAQGLYQRVCLRLGKGWTAEGEAEWMDSVYAFYGDAAGEELDVVPSQGSGAWLSRALIEARMVAGPPVLRLTMPDEFKHWAPHLREAEIRDWCERELRPLLADLPPELLVSVGEDFGRVNVVINNAGIINRKIIRDMTPEEWRRVIDVNLTGTFIVTRAATSPGFASTTRSAAPVVADPATIHDSIAARMQAEAAKPLRSDAATVAEPAAARSVTARGCAPWPPPTSRCSTAPAAARRWW